jgi:hypothetical protein
MTIQPKACHPLLNDIRERIAELEAVLTPAPFPGSDALRYELIGLRIFLRRVAPSRTPKRPSAPKASKPRRRAAA